MKLGRGHPDTLTSRVGLAGTYEALDRWADAELFRRQNLACRRAAETPDQLLLASDLVELSRDLVQQGKSSEAEPLLRECVAIREKAIPHDWRRYFAMSLLGRALLYQQKCAEAEPLVVAGYEGLEAREAKIPAVSKADASQCGGAGGASLRGVGQAGSGPVMGRKNRRGFHARR